MSHHCKERKGDDCECKIRALYDVLAIGLRNPSGFTFTKDSIYITEPGLTDPTLPPTGAPTFTGRISQISCNGNLTIRADNLLGLQGAAEGREFENIGLVDITELNGKLYVLKNFSVVTGLFGPDSITGVYLFNPDTGTLTLIADLAAFDIANSPATSPNSTGCEQLPPPLKPGAPSSYAMVAWKDKLYITNGHTDTIDIVDVTIPPGPNFTDNISRLVNFSDVLTPGAPPCGGAHPVLTGITTDPCKKFLYVVQLTAFLTQPTSPPGPPNNASIYQVSKDGSVKIIATGYSYGTGIAVDVDGSIYISQFTKFIPGGADPNAGIYVNPGSLVRFNPKTGTFDIILTPLILPGSLHIKGKYLYLLKYTQTGDAGQGELIRINLCKYRLHGF